MHECTAPLDVSLAEDDVTQTIKPSAFYLHKSLPDRPRPPSTAHLPPPTPTSPLPRLYLQPRRIALLALVSSVSSQACTSLTIVGAQCSRVA